MPSRTDLIRQALVEFLVPIVEREDGHLYLANLQEHEVTVHLAGRYAGSPAASLFYQEFILPLVETVAPGTIVHWSSGRVTPRDAELLHALPEPMEPLPLPLDVP